MITYAGIGSREINDAERKTIHSISEYLSSKNYYVSSGNCHGGDQAFQEGSQDKCIIWVPDQHFKRKDYDYQKYSYAWKVAGESLEGCDYALKNHPLKDGLKSEKHAYTLKLMARNYHQVMCGEANASRDGSLVTIPEIKFLVACADPIVKKKVNGLGQVEMLSSVDGGTGFAWDLAQKKGIPCVTIRDPEWKVKLRNIVNALESSSLTRVVNVKVEKPDIAIGRPSKWGNPFIMGKDGTREDVVRKYGEWILKQPELLNSLHELKGKKIGCFCAPEKCHGDVLAKLTNEKFNK